MRVFLLFSIIYSSCLGLVACNGTGFTIPPGTSCPDDFQAPALTNLPANQKVFSTDSKAKPGASGGLPAGTYTYNYADLIYMQSATAANAPSPLVVQIHDGFAGDSQVHPASTACVRTTMLHFTPQKVTAQSASDLTVDANGNVTVTQQRVFAINIMANQILPVTTSVTPPSANAKSGPGSVFDTSSAKPINSLIVQDSPTDYEIRAQYNCANDVPACTYVLALHMNFAPPPPQPTR